MKIKLCLVVSCALLSVGSSVVLQAMQGQQEITEQSALTSLTAINKFYDNLIRQRMSKQDFRGALDALSQGIEHGFDVNANKVAPLLNQAIINGGNIELIRELLAAGADVTTRVMQDHGPLPFNRPLPPLYLVMHYSYPTVPLIIEELVKAGADINTSLGTYYGAPLFYAFYKRNIPAIRTLLSMPNINVATTNLSGKTVYDAAKLQGDQEIINLFKTRPLKILNLEAVKKAKEQGKITQEEIKQRLPLELQEALEGPTGHAAAPEGYSVE